MLFFVAFYISLFGSCQNDDLVSQAKTLKEQYEEEDVVISKQYVEISFDRNKSTGKVEVTEQKKTTYLGISPYAKISYSSGYDNESSIEKLKLINNKGRSQSWDLSDEAYSSESIFHNDYRIKYGTLVFPLQGTQKIIEEEKHYDDIKYFTSHYFTDSFRVLEGQVVFNIPDWLDIDLKEYNFQNYEILKSDESFDNGTSIVFNVSNIKAGKQEYAMQGNSFIYPHLLLLPKSFTAKDGSQKTLFKETGDLYKWYSKLVQEVKVDPLEIKKTVEDLVTGLSTDEEKVKAIYYWVQDNIKYIAFEDGIAGFKPDAPQNVFMKRYGDCKGMAILLKTMLKEAGYDARLTWIGTDNIAYDYSTPSLSVDNHMITSIMMDGKTIFIDGTEKFNKFGTFASRIQGKQALIEDGDDYILAKVPVSEAANNLESYEADFKIEGDDIVGTMKKTYTGEQVSQFLYNFTGLPTDQRMDVLKNVLKDRNDNVKIENTSTFDYMDRDQDIHINYDFKIKGAVSNFDDTYYLELDPVKYLSNFQFEDERENNYQFTYKRQETKKIKLELPDSYKVDNIPEKVVIDNDFLKANMEYAVENNQLVYTSKIIIKKRLIPNESFDEWNESIKKLKSFYDEQIVLSK